MDKRLIIEKLRECRDQINLWDEVRVGEIESPDFRAWQDKVQKWLKAAGLVALDDLKAFKGLLFCAPKGHLPGGGYDDEDQHYYDTEIARSRDILDSAIESILQSEAEAQAEYTTALICEKGHLRHLDYGPTVPPEPYCKVCGAKTLPACPSCDAPIHGRYFLPGETDLAENYTTPNHCHACGRPYPWTQARQEALVDLIRQMRHLPRQEQEELIEAVPALLVLGPTTQGAILRMKQALKKAGAEMAPYVTRFLIEYGPDIVKVGLGLSKPAGTS